MELRMRPITVVNKSRGCRQISTESTMSRKCGDEKGMNSRNNFNELVPRHHQIPFHTKFTCLATDEAIHVYQQ